MASADLLPAAVLKRKAVVYIRQSTPAQVQSNLESRRRQYDLDLRVGQDEDDARSLDQCDRHDIAGADGRPVGDRSQGEQV